MNVRDFDAIADVLKKYIIDDPSTTCIAYDIAEKLYNLHCGFDRERFFLRCGFVNWREIREEK
jgi:hypothetical protein